MKLFSIFDKSPKINIYFSEKFDGSMKPTGEESLDEPIIKNQNKFLKLIGVDKNQVVMLGQAHTKNIKRVNVEHRGKVFSNTDALITNIRDVFLSIRVADCVPVYFYDPENNAIGLIHAGWRGLAKNIIAETFKKAKNELGLNTQTTIVGIGPAICGKHYEIGEDVISKFDSYTQYISTRESKSYLDLKAVAKRQMIDAGIDAKNIDTNLLCTLESENMFSYRRDKPKHAECMITLIGMK